MDKAEGFDFGGCWELGDEFPADISSVWCECDEQHTQEELDANFCGRCGGAIDV